MNCRTISSIMLKTALILNLIAAVGFLLIATVAANVHVTHAYSTYHGLVANHALVGKPTYANGEPLDVEASLRHIGAAGMWFGILGFGAAGACTLNSLIFFFAQRRPGSTPF